MNAEFPYGPKRFRKRNKGILNRENMINMTANIRKTQLDLMDVLIEKGIATSRSELVRICLDMAMKKIISDEDIIALFIMEIK